MRYAALAFGTLSLLDLMSSSGIRVIISKKMFWDYGGFGDIRRVVNSVADPVKAPPPLFLDKTQKTKF